MTKIEQYLEALKTFDEWVTVSTWAEKVGELYPELLEAANKQAQNQANDTTGLKELASRISSSLSTGGFPEVEIDKTEKPRKVKFTTEIDKKEHIELEVASDIEPLTRAEKIKFYTEQLDEQEKYRIEEIETISKQLNKFFGVDFEVDHSTALLNQEKEGTHHPDNLQLLTKAHNGKKNKKNWLRFTIDEQIDYIKHVIALQTFIASKLKINLVNNVLDSLLERLKNVY